MTTCELKGLKKGFIFIIFFKATILLQIKVAKEIQLKAYVKKKKKGDPQLFSLFFFSHCIYEVEKYLKSVQIP